MSTVSVDIDISQWSTVESELEQIFSDYEQAQKDAKDADWADINNEEQRLRDQMEGSCDDTDDDLRRFKQAVTDTWDEAWQAWGDFKTEYELALGSGNTPPHGTPWIRLPIDMEAKRKILADEVVAKLGDFEQTLGQSTIGEHWKGEGAEGYARQLPTQIKAMSDLKAAAERTRYSLEASRMILQTIYLSVMTSVKRCHLTVQNMNPSVTDDRWAERIYTMRDLNLGLKTWFGNHKDVYGSNWGEMQSDLLSKIGETENGYSELTGEDWPAATAASEGYAPNPDAGTGESPGVPPPEIDTDGTPGEEAPQGPSNDGMDSEASEGSTPDKDQYE